MSELQQKELLESLQWLNSVTGAKDRETLSHESFQYLKQSSLLAVVRIDVYKEIIETKKPSYTHQILHIISRVLQHAFGLDHIYYYGDGIFVILIRERYVHHFDNRLRDIIRNWSILEIEGEKVNVRLRAGYLLGCPVIEKDIMDMYKYAYTLSIEADSVLGDDFLNYTIVDQANVQRFYESDTTDQVTGLLTKEDFFKLCRKGLEREPKRQKKVYMVYLNVLNFKLFNDKYGYEEGNAFLKKFAKILRELYPKALIARFESDHFYLMLYERDFKNELELIQKELSHISRNVYMEVRAGLCEIPAKKYHEIATYCDHAKISADYIKKSNEIFRIYSDTFSGRNVREKYIVENFRQAIDKKWIKLYYQPVVRTLNEELCSMEVLARWDDPTYGILSPGLFISVLEDYHLIHYLDQYIIKNICKTYRARKDANLPVYPVSFNLSRLDFELCDIFDFIQKCGENYRVPKSYLNVEITESVMANNTEFMNEKIHQFHEAGYLVWMDDFGSQYSSLNTLKEYEFDELKIDMKFLSEFNDKSKQIIASVVDMAKQLDIQTLAEGVETKEQYEFLRGIGCEKVQGYYFSKPLPLEEMFTVLKEKGVQAEQISKAEYYDEIGRVNFMSSHPFDIRSSANYESILPLALLEYRHHTFHYINANQAYHDFLSLVGIHSLSESEVTINDEKWDLANHFKAVAEKLYHTDGSEYLDFFDRDNHCVIEAKRVAVHDDCITLLVHVDNISANVGVRHDQELNSSLKLVYSFFEHVYLVDYTLKQAKTVYTNSHFSNFDDVENCDEIVKKFYEYEVYPDDRRRFLEFFAPENLHNQMARSDKDTIRELFRIKRRNGVYKWTMVTVKKLYHSSHIKAIVALSDLEKDQFVSLSDEIDITSEAQKKAYQTLGIDVLWSNILKADFGIFWKDKKRRFLGANNLFKEYYEITDDAQFIGKTDEEMGWHVDPENFKKQEEQVIYEGAVIKNERGECIVHGRLKTIIASKQPIYNNQGEIVGLIGYFWDAQVDHMLKERINSLSHNDELTDTVNLDGMMEGVRSFVESYDYRHMDFALTLFNMDNLKEFANTFGYGMGQEMVKAVAKEVKDIFGFNSLIAHPEFNVIAVLHQKNEREDYETLVHKVKEKIEAIHQIAGVRYNVYLSVSTTYYSEVEDFDKMRYLAQARLELKNFQKDGLIASDIPQYTRREIVAEMKKYMKIFDVVRFVDPETLRSTMLNKEGVLSEVPRCCYGVLGKHQRCLNCISRQVVENHGMKNKFEETPNGNFFIISKFVVIDGYEYALELIKKVENKNNDFKVLENKEQG